MRTSFFSSSRTANALKKDCRNMADDAMQAARHMTDPAIEAAQRARIYARDAMHDAQDRFNRQLSVAERYANDQYDRTSQWVSGNPMKAVAIAIGVGLLLSSLFHSSSRR